MNNINEILRENFVRNFNMERLASDLMDLIEDNIDKLEIAISNIVRIYYDFYNTLDKEELKINKKCFDDELYISSDVSADYDVYDKNGNEDDITYCTCEDIDYCWYKDEDFILN